MGLSLRCFGSCRCTWRLICERFYPNLLVSKFLDGSGGLEPCVYPVIMRRDGSVQGGSIRTQWAARSTGGQRWCGT